MPQYAPFSPKLLKALRYLDGKVSRAVRRFDLIGEADHILLALSGGKDSWSLLEVMAARRRWAREQYELTACHVLNPGCTENRTRAALQARCDQLAIGLVVVEQDPPVSPAKVPSNVGHRPPTNCFHCAWERRRLLFQTADRQGCQKVALGHHLDDILETLLLNLLFHGEISTMAPKQSFFEGRLFIVRPLALVEERVLKRVAHLAGAPACRTPCSVGSSGQRAKIRQFLAEVSQIHTGVRQNLLRLALPGVTDD